MSAFLPRFASMTILAAALSAALSGSAIGQASADTAPPPPLRTVETTTGMVADLARSVLGDGVEVRAIMGPGVDPHLYKPLRDDVVRILRADLIVTNGLMLEGKMGEVLARAGRDRWVIAIGDGLDPARVIRPEDAEGHPDPHVWMDPTLWAQGAEAFAEALAQRRPAEGARCRALAAAYASQLRELDTWAKEAVATIPAERRILITSHDAFAYLGRAYGLRVEGVQGISTDSEPGLRRIGELVDLVVENRVPAVFVESSVPRKSIEALVEGARARGHELRIGGELYSDALGESGTWEGTVAGMIDRNVTTIVRALGGKAPAKGWKGRLIERDSPQRDGGEPAPGEAPKNAPKHAPNDAPKHAPKDAPKHAPNDAPAPSANRDAAAPPTNA